MSRTIRHICITDDDPDDYYLFQTALQEVDPSVKLTWFDNCADLLHFLHIGDDLPDLLILDMNMPGNGEFQCLKAIKKEAKTLHLPVIIYSTSSTPQLAKNALEYGAHSYQVKPSAFDRIKELIQDMLLISIL